MGITTPHWKWPRFASVQMLLRDYVADAQRFCDAAPVGLLPGELTQSSQRSGAAVEG
jgi:hypothetical protein